MTLVKKLDVRFIEYMPLAGQNKYWLQYYMSLDQVLETARRIAPLSPLEGKHGGPAQYYRLKNAPGTIGLIPSISRHICRNCNRLRVTAAGTVKPCLFSNQEINLKPDILDKKRIKEKFREAIKLKPDPEQNYYKKQEGKFKGRHTMS